MEDRNLRQELRRALDAVAPPAPWLTSAVTTTLRERRSERWIARARRHPMQFNFAVAGLTMAVLAILVVAAILLAQLYFGFPRPLAAGHGLSNPRPSPSASSTMTAADRATLAQLEARPLHPPALLAGGACPADQADPVTGNYGNPTVYVAGGPYTFDRWGDFYDVSAYTAPTLRGPVLFRGTDIKSPNHPVVFQGEYATGPVFATDGTVQLHAELVLDTTHPVALTWDVNGTQYIDWGWRQGEKAGWAGCVYFQVDGAGFTIGILVNQPNKNGRDPGYTGA